MSTVSEPSLVYSDFFDPVSELKNVQRVYALNDEAGLVTCTWPHGDRDPIPFPYADETWTGIEYQVAASMIYAGMVDEGLMIIEAVRDRYKGFNRNPFAEIKSGYYYARAMAGWAILPALSGFQWDGEKK
ncbi:MAG: GH116 family glycosyl hydrolase [Bacteroidota bacterium]